MPFHLEASANGIGVGQDRYIPSANRPKKVGNEAKQLTQTAQTLHDDEHTTGPVDVRQRKLHVLGNFFIL
jgi:hypothetical protein